jgi:hypothetical protein
VLSSLNALPAAVKAGWVLWMIWGTAQVLWFKRARVTGPVVVSAPASAVAPHRRRPAPPPPATIDADSIIVPTNGGGSVLGLS